MKTRFPFRDTSLLLICLSVLFCQIASPVQARLGDDQAGLEKRFGKGKPVESVSISDHGLWGLFDSVLSYEKNGIGITVGLVEDRCEAIIYQRVPLSKEGENSRGLSRAEVHTLLAKNAGEGEFVLRRTDPKGTQYWEMKPDGPYARVESILNKSGGYSRVSIYSSSLFGDLEQFEQSTVRPEFLRHHPPKHLDGF